MHSGQRTNTIATKKEFKQNFLTKKQFSTQTPTTKRVYEILTQQNR